MRRTLESRGLTITEQAELQISRQAATLPYMRLPLMANGLQARAIIRTVESNVIMVFNLSQFIV
jgi:hypothetical protein